uniref:Uncharacterized protein n=1 Tax=Octopus bimaculoides TaxID=37653 RepID=A0A0L8FW36_OCTBM
MVQQAVFVFLFVTLSCIKIYELINSLKTTCIEKRLKIIDWPHNLNEAPSSNPQCCKCKDNLKAVFEIKT